MEKNEDEGFSYWYHKYEYIYKAAPRDYIEKEIKFLEQQIIKMGRNYWTRLVAQHFAAKDVHHQYHDGRIRDPARDSYFARGPMYTGKGKKNSGPRLSPPSQPGQLTAS